MNEQKVISKVFGHFKVVQRIGMVAYKREISVGSKNHPLFHVSCLKKRVGDSVVTQSDLPPTDDKGRIRLKPVIVLDHRMVKQNYRPVTQMLVEWSNSFYEDATSENLVQATTTISVVSA